MTLFWDKFPVRSFTVSYFTPNTAIIVFNPIALSKLTCMARVSTANVDRARRSPFCDFHPIKLHISFPAILSTATTPEVFHRLIDDLGRVQLFFSVELRLQISNVRRCLQRDEPDLRNLVPLGEQFLFKGAHCGGEEENILDCDIGQLGDTKGQYNTDC